MLLTVDRRIPDQQNWPRSGLAVWSLEAKSNDHVDLAPPMYGAVSALASATSALSSACRPNPLKRGIFHRPDRGLRVVAAEVGVPPSRVEKSLHSLWSVFADGSGHLPTVFAFSLLEQPCEVATDSLLVLGTGKQYAMRLCSFFKVDDQLLITATPQPHYMQPRLPLS